MNEELFVQRKTKDWNRLRELCQKTTSSLKHLTPEELQELVLLHRRASTDLATLRTRSGNEALAVYLNDLVTTSYSALYRAPQQKLWAAAVAGIEFIAQTVRRNFRFVLASASIFVVSWCFVVGLLMTKPELTPELIPPQMEAAFEVWTSGRMMDRTLDESVMMTSFYASNNPRVSIIVGAVGAGSMGIVSTYMLWQNGAVLGALSYEMIKVNKLGYLLASIFPHGVPEISGIILSAAGGLRFGWAILFPGLLTRSESLQKVSKDGLALLLAGVLLCFIAAPIEGFFSFNPNIPSWFKVAAGCVEVVAWTLFWTQFGRKEEELPGADTVSAR